MCLFTSARTVAIVFARSAGSEAMYCAGVLTFDGGFMDSSSSRTKCITERLKTSQRDGRLRPHHLALPKEGVLKHTPLTTMRQALARRNLFVSALFGLAIYGLVCSETSSITNDVCSSKSSAPLK